MSPFSSSSFVAEGMCDADYDALRVDRHDEVSTCLAALCERQNHVLIHGSAGVGKTFLTRIVAESLRARQPTVLPCRINLMPSLEGGVAGFPVAVVQKLCMELWTQFLDIAPEKLRDAAIQSPNKLDLRSVAAKKVAEIYRLVRIEEQRLRFNDNHELQAGIGIKAARKESRSREWNVGTMQASDVIDLVGELWTTVAAPRNIERFILICDDIHMLEHSEHELLLRFVELFSAKRGRFVFVMREHAYRNATALLPAFESLELSGFTSRTIVAEFLEKHLSRAKVDAEAGAIDVVWEIFKGHPVRTLSAARQGYEIAKKARRQSIDVASMAIGAAAVLREVYEQRNLPGGGGF